METFREDKGEIGIIWLSNTLSASQPIDVPERCPIFSPTSLLISLLVADDQFRPTFVRCSRAIINHHQSSFKPSTNAKKTIIIDV